MPNHEPRSDDEYEQLKINALLEISGKDPEVIFDHLKKDLLNKIKSLNVNNITEVENFYLLVAKFNRCLLLICAKNKSESKQISFEEAFSSIGPDDIVDGYIENFKKEMEQSYFHKIKDIDEKYAPGTESWTSLHLGCLMAYNSLKEGKDFKLTSLVEKSISLLEIEKNRFKESGDDDLAEKAEDLIKSIEISTKNYLIHQNENLFKEEINDAITKASFITEEQGWKGIVDNIARMILSFFCIEPNSRFSFFTNPIKENVKELQDGLSCERSKKNQCS